MCFLIGLILGAALDRYGVRICTFIKAKIAARKAGK